MTSVRDQLEELASGKWARYCAQIEDPMMRITVAAVIQNTSIYLQENGSLQNVSTELIYSIIGGALQGISAYSIVSFQPMLTPNGMIFHMQAERGEGSNIPELNLTMVSSPISATEKSAIMRFEQSLSQAIRMRDRFGRDSMVEILVDAAQELSAHVDTTIIREIYEEAPTVEDKRISDIHDFLTVAIEASGVILQNSGRAVANQAIVSSLIYENLLKAQDNSLFQPTHTQYQQIALRPAGSLSGRWEVFVHPYFNDNDYMFCAKGLSPFDCGYVFSPYAVTYAQTMSPERLTNAGALALMYGSKLVVPQYYCKGKVDLVDAAVLAEELKRPKFYRKLNIQYD